MITMSHKEVCLKRVCEHLPCVLCWAKHSVTLEVRFHSLPTGRPITGPELATLLEILVTAANEGSLAEVRNPWSRGEGERVSGSELSYSLPFLLQIPGRWQVFIDQLKTGALEDCAAFYESDVTALLDTYENSKNSSDMLSGCMTSQHMAHTSLRNMYNTSFFPVRCCQSDRVAGM